MMVCSGQQGGQGQAGSMPMLGHRCRSCKRKCPGIPVSPSYSPSSPGPVYRRLSSDPSLGACGRADPGGQGRKEMPTGCLGLAESTLTLRPGWTLQLDVCAPPQGAPQGHWEQALTRSAHQPCTEPVRLQRQGPEQEPGGGDMATATHLTQVSPRGHLAEPRDPQHLATAQRRACVTEEPERGVTGSGSLQRRSEKLTWEEGVPSKYVLLKKRKSIIRASSKTQNN